MESMAVRTTHIRADQQPHTHCVEKRKEFFFVDMETTISSDSIVEKRLTY
jgi:hypothetical protein